MGRIKVEKKKRKIPHINRRHVYFGDEFFIFIVYQNRIIHITKKPEQELTVAGSVRNRL